MDRIAAGTIRKAPPGLELRRVWANGQTGLVTTLGGRVVDVLTSDVTDGRIAACYVAHSPDKPAWVGTAAGG